MDDKLLKSLKSVVVPQPSASARQQAIEQAMAAFDAAQENAFERREQKKPASVQGLSLRARLRSITSKLRRNWTMDMRLPLGATFAAILIVPLGWHFMNQTALTPPDRTVWQQPAEKDFEIAESPSIGTAGEEAAITERSEMPVSEPAMPPVPSTVSQPAAPAPQGGAVLNSGEMQSEQSAAPGMSAGFASLRSGIVRRPEMAIPGDRFAAFEEAGVQIVAENPVSTFSVDVDTASYAYVRRMLDMGQLPQRDAIRVEELINYFSYDYPVPEVDGAPFEPMVAVHPSPWNDQSRLVHIGIKGQAIEMSEAPPANLVLLIDTSGSMDAPDRLPLLKRAFGLLINELGEDDTVSIVTYAGSAGVVLEPTSGAEKAEILQALDDLRPGGSTAGAAGIETAYRLARQAMIEGGTNRVLLATDGDFNVGISDPGALEDFIARRRDEGIALSVLGFGMGNYNDAAMQALAQAGNGNAAYIDSFAEARKVLVEEMGGTLMTIASDVKVQVEFNPAAVSEYRLIGYETRALNREDFNNDAVDAGEVGAGHTVTAIYEITPVGAPGSVDPLRYGEANQVMQTNDGDEYGYLKIRYKAPGETRSSLIETPIAVEGQYGDLSTVPDDMQFAAAVAAFGQKLRGSHFLANMDWDEIAALARAGRGDDETGRRAEFIRLIETAASIAD